MGITIPGLSQAARAELTRLAATMKETRQLSAERIVTLDPETLNEFAAVSKAIDARFGRNALLRGGEEIASLVAPAERKKFEVVQDSFKVLQQAIRVYENQKIIAQRDTRIAIQPRTIER